MLKRYLFCSFVTFKFVFVGAIDAQDKKYPTADELQSRFGSEVEMYLDQPYAGTENPKQMLDLFVPKIRQSDEPLPVIVYIHGGAWKSGDRKGSVASVASHAKSGNYAGVTISYRLSEEAKWPAQIHDCKAAIRWIRGNAKKYGLNPEKIGVQGGSAGGHLASLIGLSADSKELEGNLGPFPNERSRVACVVNYCGPSDLARPLMQGEAAMRDDTAVTGLVGGALKEKQDAVRAASPIHYVSSDDPPVMIVHGTKDERVDFKQAEWLHEALKKAGANSILLPVIDSGHGIQGGVELSNRVRAFYDQHLRGIPTEISTEPLPLVPSITK